MGYDLSDKIYEVFEGYHCKVFQDEDGDITINVKGTVDSDTFYQLETAVSNWSDLDGGEYGLPFKDEHGHDTVIWIDKLSD